MRIPWVTLAFVGVAAAAGFSPTAVDRIEYRHAAAAAGEWWRPFGAQLVHWSGRMTAADLGAVLVLGSLLERRSRAATVLAILLAVALTGLGLHFLPPEVGRYRGASSIASALFVALACAVFREATSVAGRGAALAMLGLFGLKLVIEAGSGQALFAGEMAEGVGVSTRAHLLGGIGGAAAWMAAGRPGGAPASPARP